jgi:hypothetical protein
MIVKGHPVFLDWGLTSFQALGHVFQPYKEIKYHAAEPLFTGAYDFFALLYSILTLTIEQDTENSKQITLDVLGALDRFGALFYEEKGGKCVPLSTHLKAYVHSYENGIFHNNELLFEPKERLFFYTILKDLEKHTTSQEMKEHIHSLHVDRLQSMTYAMLSQLFDPPLLDPREIREAQSVLPPELFEMM